MAEKEKQRIEGMESREPDWTERFDSELSKFETARHQIANDLNNTGTECPLHKFGIEIAFFASFLDEESYRDDIRPSVVLAAAGVLKEQAKWMKCYAIYFDEYTKRFGELSRLGLRKPSPTPKRQDELAGKPWKLWDMTHKLPLLKTTKIFRVRARSENEAHEIAAEMLGGIVHAKRADKKRRKVFDWRELEKQKESGSTTNNSAA